MGRMQERLDRKLQSATAGTRQLTLSVIEVLFVYRLMEWATESYDLPFTVDDVYEEVGDLG